MRKPNRILHWSKCDSNWEFIGLCNPHMSLQNVLVRKASAVTCKKCLKYKAYKKDLLDFELKFDGTNLDAFEVYRTQQYMLLKSKK